MKATYLIAEIGSTTTVVTAFGPTDEKNFARIAQGQAPTSVADGDVTIGLKAALQEAEQSSSTPLEWEQMIASSSAAGGLRMTVHGLVYDMTAKAAKVDCVARAQACSIFMLSRSTDSMKARSNRTPGMPS